MAGGTSRRTPAKTNEHDEPYEACIVDANGVKVDGISVWLDDACHDDNGNRLANAELIVRAVNFFIGHEWDK